MGEAFPVAGEGAGPGMLCETGTGRGDMGRGTEEAARLIPRRACAQAGAPGRAAWTASTTWVAGVAIAAVHRAHAERQAVDSCSRFSLHSPNNTIKLEAFVGEGTRPKSRKWRTQGLNLPGWPAHPFCAVLCVVLTVPFGRERGDRTCEGALGEGGVAAR